MGRRDLTEQLDGDDLSLPEVEEALSDIERSHRWLFGWWSVRQSLLAQVAAGGPRQLWVDVGAGNGHVASSLRSAARSRNIRARVIAVDRKLAHLVVGRRTRPALLGLVADAAALPLRTNAVDGSFSNLLFHHHDADGNRRVLAEMVRVARRSALVLDLRRSVILAALARVSLRVLGLGRVAFEDGLTSVARSYTIPEVRRIVAPWVVIELEARFPGRFSLVLAAGTTSRDGAIGTQRDLQSGGEPARSAGSDHRQRRS